MLGRCGAAVLELRRNVALFAVEGSDFDADLAIRCGDVGVMALEADTAVLADANAQGAGLSEDQLL